MTSVEIAQFWVVGSGGLNETPPVFLSPHWPPDLAGPLTNAKAFDAIDDARLARDAAQIHALGRCGNWKVYGVSNEGRLIEIADQ